MKQGSARRLLVRGALLAAAALLGAEVALRALGVAPLAGAGYPAGLYVADKETRFALAPSFTGTMQSGAERIELATNPQGFRDAPFGPKAPGTLRVLALGDSFAFGHGVGADEAYPKELERLLARPSRPVEVLNLGVPGYNTAQELALLRRAGAELDPDLVLLGCYVGNDLSGNLERRQALPRARHGVLVAASLGEPEWRVSLRAGLYNTRASRAP